MYATPTLRILDLATSEASCCRVIVNDTEVINTGICPFPTCGGTTTGPIAPCTVSVGPVTVSGT